MKRESAKQSAEERQRRAATRRKIFLNAKGWMLIKTMLIMAIISTGRAKQWRGGMGEDAPFGGCSLYGIDLAAPRPLNKHRGWKLDFVSSTSCLLMPDEGAREAQVFFRFPKVWLKAQCFFVVSNG